MTSVSAEQAATMQAIEAVFQMEWSKLVAALTRLVRDLDLAEELAQDALVAALQQWPEEGIPRNAGAWLMASAKHRALDHLRRRKLIERKHGELLYESEVSATATGTEAELDEDVGDDLLRLMLIACHPILAGDGKVALTLRLLGGLSTAEIARAFLVAESTVAQRIVRAKRTLAEARVTFEVPGASELPARVGSVLDAIYLIFNEGYSATAGDDLIRPALCEEALRLSRVLAELVPENAEAHGLAGLLEIQASRTGARVSSTGEPILLLEQNRGLWNQLMIRRGFAALERAQKIDSQPGFYVLQAAIAACHARARTAAETDWIKIAGLYAQLAEVAPSPVIELNRAVAVSMAYGAEAGLEIVEALIDEPLLSSYHLLPSVRADLLAKLDRFAEAEIEFRRAASLTENSRERDLLLRRAGDAVNRQA